MVQGQDRLLQFQGLNYEWKTKMFLHWVGVTNTYPSPFLMRIERILGVLCFEEAFPKFLKPIRYHGAYTCPVHQKTEWKEFYHHNGLVQTLGFLPS